METDYDLAIRVIAFAVGFWNAGHYFVAANQLRKAAHWEKVILFPALVSGHIGLCLAAVFYGSGMVFLVAGALWLIQSLKDIVIWQAGAYMSDVLDRRQRMREAEKQAYSLFQYEMKIPVEALSDIINPNGVGEVAKMEKREREKERA